MHDESDQIFRLLEEREDLSITGSSPLTGGSINTVHVLNTSVGQRVLKLNKASRFPGMFEAEKEGLQELRASGAIDVPEVFGCGETGETAYLLLEYKEESRPAPDFWQRFAQDLAALHQTTRSHFGFRSSNYIGSLPQYNDRASSAAEFYISRRLEPQLKMASERGFTFKNTDLNLKNIAAEIPEEPPALIHGDLWSGNYLINEKGLPCLIDPAVCYGPREMDLAMMKLFGGFREEVFSHYNESFPLKEGSEERVELWQLYYLLVHLNIFGSSYLSGVQNILRKYS